MSLSNSMGSVSRGFFSAIISPLLKTTILSAYLVTDPRSCVTYTILVFALNFLMNPITCSEVAADKLAVGSSKRSIQHEGNILHRFYEGNMDHNGDPAFSEAGSILFKRALMASARFSHEIRLASAEPSTCKALSSLSISF